MDLKDFVNNDKYKVILPIIHIVNAAMMLTMPFLWPEIYRYYILVIWSYGAYKATASFGGVIIASIKGF